MARPKTHRAWQLLRSSDRAWPQVRNVLVRRRALRPEVLESCRRRGLIYAYVRHNGVFLCTDANGQASSPTCASAAPATGCVRGFTRGRRPRCTHAVPIAPVRTRGASRCPPAVASRAARHRMVVTSLSTVVRRPARGYVALGEGRCAAMGEAVEHAGRATALNRLLNLRRSRHGCLERARHGGGGNRRGRARERDGHEPRASA